MSGGGQGHWRADLALAGITLIWGATFVTVKAALADVSTLLFLALRFSLAAVLLLVAFRGRLGGGDLRLAVKGGVLAGVCLISGYTLQTFGLLYTTASKSAFLTGMCTVMVPLVSAVVYRRRPAVSELLGVAISATGMGLMTLERMEWKMGFGDLLTLGCALAFALHIVVLGHYSPRVGFERLSLIQIATSAALTTATFSWCEPWHIRWTPGVVSALLITGALATALAFTVQSWAQRHSTPTRTALLLALEPVFAWMTSFLLLGERLSARPALGAGLILAGVLVVELKLAERWRRASAL
jgi:drug/metabolite transporter (DMT)-like permease